LYPFNLKRHKLNNYWMAPRTKTEFFLKLGRHIYNSLRSCVFLYC
jgi:hypothetical protein